MYYKKFLYAKTNHRQGHILNGFIKNTFHKVKPKLRSKTHLLYAVMHFMEFPKPGAFVQLPVYIPLNKVCYDKHDEQLRPSRKFLYINSHQIGDAKKTQKIIKQLDSNI